VSTQQDDLRSWIGRSETIHDTIHPTPVLALTATLDHPPAPIVAGTPLPALWHWLYFLPMHRQSEIGADGHARRGGFLPLVPLPRRMWAGSQFEFRVPIRVGDRVARTSTIDDVSVKEGRTGQLVFVKCGTRCAAWRRRKRASRRWIESVRRGAGRRTRRVRGSVPTLIPAAAP
jgi:3-methylfumaryl-CoA hydratase